MAGIVVTHRLDSPPGESDYPIPRGHHRAGHPGVMGPRKGGRMGMQKQLVVREVPTTVSPLGRSLEKARLRGFRIGKIGIGGNLH